MNDINHKIDEQNTVSPKQRSIQNFLLSFGDSRFARATAQEKGAITWLSDFVRPSHSGRIVGGCAWEGARGVQ